MPDIEIVIKCTCGKPLRETARETESIYGNRLTITVEPCEDCMDEADSEGYKQCERDYAIGDDYNDD